MKFDKFFQFLAIILFLGVLVFLAYFVSRGIKKEEEKSKLVNVGESETFIFDKSNSEKRELESSEEIEIIERNNAGIANPASQKCIEDGGSLEIRDDENGNQTGYCIFMDGKQCEEWAYFNGECE